MQASTSAVGTSPRPACRQRGRRSLSISSARTPSTKSCADSTRCTIRYSKRNASSIDSSRPRRSCAKVSARANGDFRAELASCSAPEAAGLGRQPRQHRPPGSRPAKQRSIPGRRARNGVLGPRTGSCSARHSAMASCGSAGLGACDQRALELPPAGPTAPHASPRRHRRSRHRSSLAPVSPRYMPTSPGQRGRNQVPPTSGKKPIPVSGMANRVRSVAIRKSPCTEIPTPPPMVMPSSRAT